MALAVSGPRSLTMRERSVPLQYGDQMGKSSGEALRMLGSIVGPIPRNVYPMLDDALLAQEIRRRYTAKKIQMGPRLILDMRLLKWYDPERIQDHWQNVWTGIPLPKMRHATGLAAGVFNMTKPVVETLVSLFAGADPFPYMIDVKPRSETNPVDRLQSEGVEKWLQREVRDQKYERTYLDGITNIITIGRNWKYVHTHPRTRRIITENPWPGNVAAFWQQDLKTLESVTVSTEMTPAEALGWWPDKAAEIFAATVGPSNRFEPSGYNLLSPLTWARYSHITVLTHFWRTMDDKIGSSCVLLNSMGLGPAGIPNPAASAVMLERFDTTELTDVPLVCTPRFKTPKKPPDEAQGVLIDAAGLNTELDEVLSANRDMLWRAIYARYKAKGFSKAPRLARGTAIYPLPRQGMDIDRINDVVDVGPVMQFITKIEEYMLILPGINEHFLGRTPPQTSQEAINAAINASISRQGPTKKNVKWDELWMYGQWIDQGNAYGEATDTDGTALPLSTFLYGRHDIELAWEEMTPRDAVRAKQMAISAFDKNLISRRRTQREFNVLSNLDEDEQIKREVTDPLLRPASVASTAEAMVQSLNLQLAKKREMVPEPPKAPDVRFVLSGKIPDQQSAEIAAEYTGAKEPTTGATISGPTGQQSIALDPSAAAAGGPTKEIPTQQIGAAQRTVKRINAREASVPPPPSGVEDNTPGGAGGPAQ